MLTFTSAPDFEIPTDSDANNVYVVQVTANDGTNTADQTITVTILNLSDTLPAAAGGTITINEDITYFFSLSDFGFSDADGDTLASITLTTIRTPGGLFLTDYRLQVV